MYTEVSSFQEFGIDVYRGVLISGSWNRGFPLYSHFSGLEQRGSTYTEVSSF